jgi:anti-sigma B factor antagonist
VRNRAKNMGRTRTLEISIRVVARATIVDLEGAVDLGNSPVLRARLFEIVPAASRLALNMSGVQYIDSSGIATLIEVLKKTRDSKKAFVLFGLGPRVYDVLKLTNLLGVFQILDSEERALDADAAS